jgi:hypothetical protein
LQDLADFATLNQQTGDNAGDGQDDSADASPVHGLRLSD